MAYGMMAVTIVKVMHQLQAFSNGIFVQLCSSGERLCKKIAKHAI